MYVKIHFRRCEMQIIQQRLFKGNVCKPKKKYKLIESSI